jgi:hypothetical protein
MMANSELSGEDIEEWLEDSDADEDKELYSLLIAASDAYESSQSLSPVLAGAPVQTSSSRTHFAPPTIEEELQRATDERIPQTKDTKFYTNMWETWREEREKRTTQKYHH